MRGKPHPWGFKLWARAGISGKLYAFDIYQGSVDGKRRPSSALGLSGDAVLQMVNGLQDGKNYKIFVDNFFTTPAQVESLKRKSMFFVGTYRANRLKGCKLKTEKELKQLGRGSHHFKVDLMSNIVAVRWFDNKSVDILSSYASVEPQDTTERYEKKEKKKDCFLSPCYCTAVQ